MCGIAGIVGPLASSERVAAMCNRIAHRGPDSNGFYVRPGVALGMQRLSIIDLAGGSQPIRNEDGKIWTVYNGEIYNYREVRKRLHALGHEFYTQSDTELLVHSYEQFGNQMCNPLRGMYAFAIWDEREQRLTIGRDRLGKKPLYYTQVGDSLVFASEIKALFCVPQVPAEIDPLSVDLYFTFGYVPAPRTMFRRIFKLLPGHQATFSQGTLKTEKYWDIYSDPSDCPGDASEDRWLEWLAAKLDESVQLRMVSDVPVGAFLSGGIDSSLVVALMRRHATGKLNTFSVRFREQGAFDEGIYAREVAEFFETDHHELTAECSSPELLTKVAWHMDEPIADPAAVPTFLVSQLARQHVKVVSSGEGADEIFAGYGQYFYVQRLSELQNYIPRLLRAAGSKLMRGWRESGNGTIWRDQARKVLLGLTQPVAQSYPQFGHLVPELQRQRWYSPELRSRLGQYNGTVLRARSAYLAEIADRPALDQALYADVKTWLPDELLMKVDKMSMANSLEARAPYLDHELVSGSFHMPPHLKTQGRITKYILRQFGKAVLPSSIWNRPKHGFMVPYGQWFTGPLRGFVKETLCAANLRTHGLFDSAGIEQMLGNYLSPQGNGEKETRALWGLLCFQLWHDLYIKQKAYAAPQGTI